MCVLLTQRLSSVPAPSHPSSPPTPSGLFSSASFPALLSAFYSRLAHRKGFITQRELSQWCECVSACAWHLPLSDVLLISTIHTPWDIINNLLRIKRVHLSIWPERFNKNSEQQQVSLKCITLSLKTAWKHVMYLPTEAINISNG